MLKNKLMEQKRMDIGPLHPVRAPHQLPDIIKTTKLFSGEDQSKRWKRFSWIRNHNSGTKLGTKTPPRTLPLPWQPGFIHPIHRRTPTYNNDGIHRYQISSKVYKKRLLQPHWKTYNHHYPHHPISSGWSNHSRGPNSHFKNNAGVEPAELENGIICQI